MSPSESNGFMSRGLGGYQDPRQNRINGWGNASDSNASDETAVEPTYANDLGKFYGADENVAKRVQEILFARSVPDATNMNTLQIGAPKKTNTNNSTTPTTWSYTTFDEWQDLMAKGIKTPAIQRNGAPKHTNTNNSEARATYYTFDEWKALIWPRGTKTSVDQHSQGKTQAVLLAEEALAAAEALKLLNASEKIVQAAKDRLSLAKTWPAVPELEEEL